MVVYPAQTIFLSIVGCKLLQLMRKGFTWKLDQSMRIRIQRCFRDRALWLYLQEVHGRRKRRCKGNDIKYPTYVHFWSNFQYKVVTVRFFLHPLRFLHRQFICRCKDNGKATLDYDFQGFFCLHHSSCSYFSFDFILLIPAKLPMQLHHVRKTTNIHTSVFTVIYRESKIDPSDASGRMLDNVNGDIEHCHTLIINTFSDCSRKTKYFAKIASEEERKMWINGEPSDLR
ncbi:hypothetical protein Bca52824_052969 [Brassica carinata]|uniref:Uncharacterized protein n=1 Tax=Brassica carinata TaxID=52824 RepID=A0A8X7R3A2_BRACI|nr:hypothetical protein Bca52824_052969 [Brassica carinata]